MKTIKVAVMAALLVGTLGSYGKVFADDDVYIDVTKIEVYVDEDQNFKFKGQVRFGGTYEQNYEDFDDDGTHTSFNGSQADDAFGYWPYRVRAGFLARLPKDVFGYVEFQTASAAGLNSAQRDVLFSNFDNLDMYMGFIKMNDIGGTNNELYFGRQELVFGNQFLFGNLQFYNGVSHDGIRYRYDGEENDFDAFTFQTTETGDLDTDQYFIGGNWTNTGWLDEGDVSAYLIFSGGGGADSGVGNLSLYTLGVRAGQLMREEGGFIWNAEIAAQFGTIGKLAMNGEDADISAFGGEWMFGYDFGSEEELQNEIYIGGYYASGDDNPTDKKAKTFNPLYQDFHRRNGIADIVPNTNIASLSIGYNLRTERQRFGVELLAFALAETQQDLQFDTMDGGFPGSYYVMPTRVGHGPDGVAGQCGSPYTMFCDGLEVTPQGANVDKDALGTEIDLLYDYIYSENLQFNFGLGYFMPGDAIQLANVNYMNHDDPAMVIYGRANLTW